MTLGALFTEVDEVKPSQYDDAYKLRWLNEVEGRIVKELLETRMPDVGMEGFEFHSYTEETPLDTELIAKEPYAILYKYYLMAQIDLINEEIDRYHNSAVLFNQAYQDFSDYWCRTHKTKYPTRYKH